ncbi:uncharacterized protein LOC136009047 [Lathamus discolor]|uniref:uncharacterized protein LOC136009047 n=1 Tax=Lathamus discolor TaxID=678569 RepID=UPI0032B7F118
MSQLCSKLQLKVPDLLPFITGTLRLNKSLATENTAYSFNVKSCLRRKIIQHRKKLDPQPSPSLQPTARRVILNTAKPSTGTAQPELQGKPLVKESECPGNGRATSRWGSGRSSTCPAPPAARQRSKVKTEEQNDTKGEVGRFCLKPQARPCETGSPRYRLRASRCQPGRGELCHTRTTPPPPPPAQLCNERRWPPQPPAAAAGTPVPASPGAPRRPADGLPAGTCPAGGTARKREPKGYLPPVPPAPGVMQHRPPSAEPPAAAPPRRGDTGHPQPRGGREVEALPPAAPGEPSLYRLLPRSTTTNAAEPSVRSGSVPAGGGGTPPAPQPSPLRSPPRNRM